MADNEFTGLQLSADDVRQLTGWGDAMVEDYISVVEKLNEIQFGGATNDEVLAALKELVEQHVANTDNPHATSLVNLIDTLILNEKNGDLLMLENGRWINRQLSDVISSCCKDLIIISAQPYDKILSGKGYFDIGLRLTVAELNTDYVGLKVISLADTGFSGTGITYDSKSFSIGASSFNGNIFWHPSGTAFWNRISGTSTQLKFQKHNVATAWDVSTVSSSDTIVTLPAITNSGSSLGVWWISADGLTLVSQGYDDFYQFDMSVAFDLSTATYTKTALNKAIFNGRRYGVALNNETFYIWQWYSGTSQIYKYNITDDNDVDTIAHAQTFDYETIDLWSNHIPQGIMPSADGEKLFLLADDNFTTRHLLTYTLSAPFDISALTLASDLDSVFTYSTQGGWLSWSQDGAKCYDTVGGSTDVVYQYSSVVSGGGITAKLYHDNNERLVTLSDGVKSYGVQYTYGADAQYVLPTYATASEPTEYDGSLIYNGSVLRLSWYNGTEWKLVSTKSEHDTLRAEFDVLEGEVDVIRTELDPLLDIQEFSIEPTGMYDRAETTTAFDDATRTFSITRTGADFTYFIHGVMHTITSDLSVVVPDTEGFYYFYLDDDETIKYLTSFNLSLIQDYSWLGNVYWDATNNERIMFADERHGLTMDSATHAHLHLSLGAQYISGLGLADFDSDGSGNDNSAAQFSVASGLIRDEDIPHLIPAYGLPANIPIIWRTGATGEWRKKAADDFPLLYSGSGGYTGASGLPAYNEWTGTTWQLTEVSNRDFMLMHYYATNDVDSHIIAIVGQNEYSTLNNARDGANVEITNVGTVPYEEWTPVATVIFQARTSYTNTPKARVRTTDQGYDYIDWRTSAPEAGAPLGDHGTLGGLGDDDHLQYHNDARGDARYEPIFAKNTAFNKDFGTGAGEVLEGDTFIPLNWVQLGDTPALYTGFAGYAVRVNGAETGLEFYVPSGATAWGSITGTLSAQTDLQAELDDKVDTAGDTMTGNLNLLDSVQLQLGTGADLLAYHNGGNGVLKNITGGLFIESASYTIAAFTQSAAKLYFESSQKIETVADGVSVTGVVSADTAPTDADHLTRKDYTDKVAEENAIAYAIALGG